MYMRAYRESDCKTITELFRQTVHTVNAKDYTKEQLNAWAAKRVDLQVWHRKLSQSHAIVALENSVIVGFGNIERTGHLDCLYVHKDYQRQGIAAAICDDLELAVNAHKITVHASITALPFFVHRGYRAIKEQQVRKEGVVLKNFVMEKLL